MYTCLAVVAPYPDIREFELTALFGAQNVIYCPFSIRYVTE